MLDTLSEVVIRLTGTDVFIEQTMEDGKVKSKPIAADSLIECISFSTRQTGIETGILPEGTIWYREEMDNSKYIVISYFNQRVDITYNNRIFKDCPMPNMLFGFKIGDTGHIYKKSLAVIKGMKVRTETELYQYPFSNVHDDYRICMGGNNLKDITDLFQIEFYPYMIISAPNNDDMFKVENNKEKLSYFELLSEIEGKETFDESLLVSKKEKVLDFMNCLKK